MKENILMIKNMDTEFINGLMEKFMKGDGLKDTKMEKESINIKVAILNIACMIRVKE